MNVAVDVLALPSVAEHVTVVVAIGNVVPDAGLHETAAGPVTASTAEAEYVTTAPLAPAAVNVRLPGTVNIGAVVSRTVTVNDPLAVLPAASLAEQVTVVVPSANVAPDGALQDGVREPLTTSVAVTT